MEINTFFQRRELFPWHKYSRLILTPAAEKTKTQGKNSTSGRIFPQIREKINKKTIPTINSRKKFPIKTQHF